MIWVASLRGLTLREKKREEQICWGYIDWPRS